jgi:hypothetical protein
MVDYQRGDELTVDHILDQRHQTYGRFIDLAEVAIELRSVIRKHMAMRGKTWEPDQEEAILMISSKLARLVNGDRAHVDSWRDIAGYATLVADRLEGRIR